MIGSVLDTNVLASGFVRPQSIPGELLRLWAAGAYRLIVSDPLIEEVGRTLQKDYFAQRLTREQRANNVRLLREQAHRVAITVQVHDVATHPEDDLILATAISAGADYLVTGDGPLQRIGQHQGVKLISPRRFVEILTEGVGAP